MQRLIDSHYREPTEMVAWAADRSFGGMACLDKLCTCATTKMLQCIHSLTLGYSNLHSVGVEDLFGPHSNPDGVWDLREEDFIARRRVIDSVNRWCSEEGREQFIPLMHRWEIAETSARKLRDWGHLLFANPSINRFLIVMCYHARSSETGRYSFDADFANFTRDNAHRFMSLVKYLSYGRDDPGSWVRATFITDDYFIEPDFFDLRKTTFGAWGPVWHVNGENFRPSLFPHEVERIDNLMIIAPWVKKPPPEYRERVMGRKSDRPRVIVWRLGNFEPGTLCGYCGKTGHKMPTCAKCKLVRYCNKDCQKAAWDRHRNVCQSWPKCLDGLYGPCPTRAQRSDGT